MFADVPTAELEAVRARLRDDSPVDGLSLGRLGGPKLARVRDWHGVSASALRLAIDAALGERASATPDPELVWTGPEGVAGTARRTSVVFRRLLETAQREVWLAGYAITHGERLFAPLHRAMAERGVRARFLLHPKLLEGEQRQASVEATASVVLNRFLRQNWPFQGPRPELWYDPRPLERRPRANMHIKAVVVDEQRVLIGSANFTEQGMDRSFEAGVLLDDARFAERLVRQLHSLIDGGHVLRYGAEP